MNPTLGGPLEAVLPLFKQGAAIFLASIGVSAGWPRTGRADMGKVLLWRICVKDKTCLFWKPVGDPSGLKESREL
jgi:hypothetical protein